MLMNVMIFQLFLPHVYRTNENESKKKILMIRNKFTWALLRVWCEVYRCYTWTWDKTTVRKTNDQTNNCIILEISSPSQFSALYFILFYWWGQTKLCSDHRLFCFFTSCKFISQSTARFNHDWWTYAVNWMKCVWKQNFGKSTKKNTYKEHKKYGTKILSSYFKWSSQTECISLIFAANFSFLSNSYLILCFAYNILSFFLYPITSALRMQLIFYEDLLPCIFTYSTDDHVSLISKKHSQCHLSICFTLKNTVQAVRIDKFTNFVCEICCTF